MDKPEEADDLSDLRQEFWAFHLDRFPDEARYGRATKKSSRWRPMEEYNLSVAQYLSVWGVGVFVRGLFGEDVISTNRRLHAHRAALEDAFKVEMLKLYQEGSGLFIHHVDGSLGDRDDWPWMAEWLRKHAIEWEGNLREALGTTKLDVPDVARP